MSPELMMRLIREALSRAAPLSAAEQTAVSTLEDLILRPKPVDLAPLTSAATAAVSAATQVVVRVEELRDVLSPPATLSVWQRVWQRIRNLFRRV